MSVQNQVVGVYVRSDSGSGYVGLSTQKSNDSMSVMTQVVGLYQCPGSGDAAG